MKIAALYCVSGYSRWLPFSYEAIYPVVDGVYFFVSDSTWYGGQPDNEPLIAQLSKLEDSNSKARLIRGSWKAETEQRNTSLAYAQADGFTHALIIDADEIYETEALQGAFRYIESKPEVGCFHVKWFTYWKNLGFRIDPVEPYDPAVIIKLGAGGFMETRNPIAAPHELIPPEILMCHHLSYVLTDEELQRKHISQTGHSQSAKADWYEQVWKRWDINQSIENLHPVNGEWFKRAVAQPKNLLPAVLRAIA